MKTKYKILLLILALLVLVAATPVLQSYTPFANIRVQHDSQLNTLTASGAANFDGAVDFDSTVDLSGSTVTYGNTDIAGTLQYGADNLYPLGYATVNQQIVCGTTAAFTATSQITPTGLTTPTYVIVSQVTQPAATIAFLTVSDPTTTTFDIYSWGSDYGAGTTGVVAHWCAIGDQ